MKIEQTVEVDAPLDRVWALVNDVPRVAPCMPGGALTKVVDERTYEGTVAVKLGPIRMNYKGTVVLESVDEAGHSAVLSAKGRDVKGSGTASAAVTTKLEPEGERRTKLHVSSDVQLTGKVASFGRGAVQDVAGKLFGQFAECLRQTLDDEQAAEATGAAADAGGGQPPATPTEPGKPAEETPEPAPPAPDDTEAPKPGVPPATPTQPGKPAGGGPKGGRPAGLTDTPERPGGTQPAAATAQPAAGAPRESAPVEMGGLIGTVVVGRLKAAGSFVTAFFRGLYKRLSRRS